MARQANVLRKVFGNPAARRLEGVRLGARTSHSCRRNEIVAPRRGAGTRGPGILPRMSVSKTCRWGPPSHPETIPARPDRVFAMFRGWRTARETRRDQSGGEQQMLASAARDEAAQRRMLLDEAVAGSGHPYSAQDLRTRSVAFSREACVDDRTGRADDYHALRLADRGYVLVNGRVRG